MNVRVDLVPYEPMSPMLILRTIVETVQEQGESIRSCNVRHVAGRCQASVHLSANAISTLNKVLAQLSHQYTWNVTAAPLESQADREGRTGDCRAGTILESEE